MKFNVIGQSRLNPQDNLATAYFYPDSGIGNVFGRMVYVSKKMDAWHDL